MPKISHKHLIDEPSIDIDSVDIDSVDSIDIGSIDQCRYNKEAY